MSLKQVLFQFLPEIPNVPIDCAWSLKLIQWLQSFLFEV